VHGGRFEAAKMKSKKRSGTSMEDSPSNCDLLKRPETHALFVPLSHKRIRFESNRRECFESQ